MRLRRLFRRDSAVSANRDSVVSANPELVTLARAVGDDWKAGSYYDDAESDMEEKWREVVWPLIRSSDFRTVVEIGAGHGRSSERLRHLAERLYLVDINGENIEFLKHRFQAATNIRYVLTNGVSLEEISDREATFVYSFDSMVHFDSDVVRAYLREFRRVLRPGGRCFCHYSNETSSPTGSYRDHPGWRNFMSKELFEHYAWKEGLAPLESKLIRWNDVGTEFDAITLLETR